MVVVAWNCIPENNLHAYYRRCKMGKNSICCDDRVYTTLQKGTSKGGVCTGYINTATFCIVILQPILSIGRLVAPTAPLELPSRPSIPFSPRARGDDSSAIKRLRF